jgi:hypothetical protein
MRTMCPFPSMFNMPQQGCVPGILRTMQRAVHSIAMPLVLLMLLFTPCSTALAQSEFNIPDRARFEDPGTLVWLGTYSTLRLTDKLYYEAQHHYRRSNYEGTPWVGRLAQIYNRHAITYRFSDRFIFTVGPVLRLNFTPDPGNPEFENLTLEPRIWHEYAFPMRGLLGARSFVLQHRIRIEHRWNRSNLVGADWVYRDRWRYRLLLKLPLNKRTFQPGTLYMDVINAEIIMQSGKTVVDAPLEDLRIYPSLGYIFSTRLAVSSGMMYTMGQRVGRGYDYRQRWVFRLNLWWTPDLRKLDKRIPETKLFD